MSDSYISYLMQKRFQNIPDALSIAAPIILIILSFRSLIYYGIDSRIIISPYKIYSLAPHTADIFIWSIFMLALTILFGWRGIFIFGFFYAFHDLFWNLQFTIWHDLFGFGAIPGLLIFISPLALISEVALLIIGIKIGKPKLQIKEETKYFVLAFFFFLIYYYGPFNFQVSEFNSNPVVNEVEILYNILIVPIFISLIRPIIPNIEEPIPLITKEQYYDE